MILKFYLKHLNDDVALINVNISMTDFKMVSFEVINENLLPVMIKNIPMKDKAFTFWWQNRIVPTSRREFYNLARVLYQIPFDKRPILNDSLYLLSLLSYGISLSDKYWFNPVSSVNIPFSRLTNKTINDIIWDVKTFEQVDPFCNKRNELLDKVFVDSISAELLIDNYYNPSICTNGNIQKYWDFIDGNYYLMKYMYNVNELNVNEIVINDFLMKNYPELSNKVYSFSKTLTDFDELEVKEHLFRFTASKCFTSPELEFVPASEIIFACGGLEEDAYDAYYLSCDILGIKDAQLPLEASEAINKHFGIQEERLFNNFGFLRDPKTRVFLRPAPLFGNSYYKYILGKDIK